MKKLTTIIGAILLVLCFTQCRKEVKTVTPEEAKGYPITLTMDETSKVDVNVVEGEHFGEVTFGAGDKIYVANKGKFVGTLTHDGSKFEGDIYDPSPSDPIEGFLFFYFLGNKTPSETNVTNPPTSPRPTTLTVDISDQSGSDLPLISCGKSDKVFSGGGSDYSARLANKCALVKFKITNTSSKNVKIAGLNNKVVFDLTKCTDVTDVLSNDYVTFSKTEGGFINVGKKTGVTWLILLPQNDDEGDMAFTDDFTYYGTRGSLKGVVANHAIKTAINVNVNTAIPEPSSYPEGAVHGLFSVSKAGGKVFFSKGNLQYIGSAGTPYWKFADNQYDYLGTTTGQNSNSATVDRDLFGWGTSGWDNGNYFYQPYCTSNTKVSPYVASIGYGYGPKYNNSVAYNLEGDYANADWGYNAISNGSATNKWRTMNHNEWVWLLGPNGNGSNPAPIPGTNCRNSSYVNGTANARFTYATINTGKGSVNGLIIFPDLYLAGTPTGVTWGVINNHSKYSTQCTSTGWDALKESGCVFLPAAGRRDGTSINYCNDIEAKGLYWSSDRNAPQTAYCLRFGHYKYIEPSQGGGIYRYLGYSVRLVTNYTE